MDEVREGYEVVPKKDWLERQYERGIGVALVAAGIPAMMTGVGLIPGFLAVKTGLGKVIRGR